MPNDANTQYPCGDKVRDLGPCEQYFWLSNQASPKHFVVCMEAKGRTHIEQWKGALESVQQRHPLLRVCIDHRAPSPPCFRELPKRPIPLRVINGEVAPDWHLELARELNEPLPPSGELLVRAVLIYGENANTVLFTTHHAIGDGISVAYMLRDLMRALSREPLLKLSTPPAQEQTFNLRKSDLSAHDGVKMSASRPPATRLHRHPAGPTIDNLQFSVEETARLRKCAREHDTTVHGALTAALISAGCEQAEGWRNAPVRLVSPVNTRGVVGIGEDFVLSILFPVGVYETGRKFFWELTRQITSDLSGARRKDTVKEALQSFTNLLATLDSVEQISNFEIQACASEAMLLNLGVLPFEFNHGALAVTAFWGPSVFVGLEGEQMIGVGTPHGSLHLLHSSYTPISGLLASVKAHLFDAIMDGQ